MNFDPANPPRVQCTCEECCKARNVTPIIKGVACAHAIKRRALKLVISSEYSKNAQSPSTPR